MAEQTESVRKDSSERQLNQKEVVDWSGKRFVLPRGTTLPPVAGALPGEIAVLIKDAGRDQLYQFDQSQNNWVTVGG